MFNGPVELQAQFLQGDLALSIELAIEQNKGMKQVHTDPGRAGGMGFGGCFAGDCAGFSESMV